LNVSVFLHGSPPARHSLFFALCPATNLGFDAAPDVNGSAL
jgi:hypothetical protein